MLFHPLEDGVCRGRRIVGHGTTRVSTDFPLFEMPIRIPPCSIFPETKIACSVLEMQDDQAIFLDFRMRPAQPIRPRRLGLCVFGAQADGRR